MCLNTISILQHGRFSKLPDNYCDRIIGGYYGSFNREETIWDSPIFLGSFYSVVKCSEQTCHALLFELFIFSTSGERNRIQGVCSGTEMACMYIRGKKIIPK